MNIFACNPLNVSLSISIIDSVLLEFISITEPVKLTLPTIFVVIPNISTSLKVFNILISWSFVNFSTGSNINLLTPVSVISVLKSPNFWLLSVLFNPTPAVSLVFSSNIISCSLVKTTISLNWVSNVSGSTTWIR